MSAVAAVEDADPLVVDGRDPGREAARLRAGRREGRRHGDGRGATVGPVGHAYSRLTEVGDQRRHLGVGELLLGHERSGLERRRVLEPAGEVLGRVRQHAAGDRLPGPDVREVGAEAARRHAAHGVAADARALSEDLQTRARGGPVGRRPGRLLLLRHPGRERLRRVHDGQVTHVGVRRAAELRALTVVLAGCVGRQHDARHAAGDRVALAPEPGDPEAVDDVGPRDLEAHRAPGRKVEIGRRRDPEIRVLEFPPPLVPDHLHAKGVLRWRGLRPEDRRHRREGDEDQDQRREDCPGELQLEAAAHLRGDRLRVALPEPEDRDQEQRLHHQEDRGVPPEDLEEDPMGDPREVGARHEGRRRRIEQAAAGQSEAEGQHPESRDTGRPRAPECRFRFHVAAVRRRPDQRAPGTSLAQTRYAFQRLGGRARVV